MPRTPLLSVLLSTHNDLRFLPGAVESILTQTMSDLELVIIDDASNDGAAEYLRSLSDPRLRVLTNPTNLGLAISLNRGLDVAAGQYVARMDDDDVSELDRFGRQLAFLEANPDVGIVGCSRLMIDEQGAVVATARAMSDHLSIRWKCLLGNPFAHPTVMLRSELLNRRSLRYDTAFRTAQDYELWTRLLPLTRAANLPEPLVRYRLRNTGLSRSRKIEQLLNHDRIILLANRRLLPEFSLSSEQARQLRGRYGGFSVRDLETNPADGYWLNFLRSMLGAFVDSMKDEPGLEAFHRRQLDWIAQFTADDARATGASLVA